MSFLWNLLGGQQPKQQQPTNGGVTVINTHTRGKVCGQSLVLTDDIIQSASKSLRKVSPAQIFVPPPSVSVHGISDKQLLWAKSHLRRITEEQSSESLGMKSDVKLEINDNSGNKKYKKVKVRRRRRNAPPLPPLPAVRDTPPPQQRPPSPASPMPFYMEYETWNW